jgi:hypothetical protein
VTARRFLPTVPAVQGWDRKERKRRAIQEGMEAATRRRAHRDRPGAVRRGRRRAHRAGAADPQPPRPLWGLSAPLSRLRPRRRASPLAHAGPRYGPGVPGSRRAPGALSAARGGRRGGSLGQARRWVHPRLRGHRRVAGDPHLACRCRGAAPGGLAYRRAGLRPGRGRADHDDRPAGGAAPHRDRRDQLQEGPALPDRGCRPRPRSAGVGRARRVRGQLGTVLRHPRRAALRQGRAGQRRRRPLDRRRGRTPLPGRGPLRRPVPRGPSGRPTRWTRSAARSGTPPARVATPPWRGSSRAPGSRCGRTPRI